MNRYTGNGYTRISRAQARKLWDAGTTVFACPCNLRPGVPWYCEAILKKSDKVYPTFNADANAAAYFLPATAETGHYLAYYVAEGVLPL